MTSSAPVLEPLEVEIVASDLAPLVRDAMSVMESECVLVGTQRPLENLAAGFRLHLPRRPVAAAPGERETARRRSRRWLDVPPGLLAGAWTGDHLDVPGVTGDGLHLWLADLAVQGVLLGRLGVVAPGRPEVLSRLAAMIAPRLARLLWERVARLWRKNLLARMADPLDVTNPDRVLRRRLDVAARELARAAGSGGSGLFTWREALRGYRLDGYWGPEMPEPREIDPSRSGWWFHHADDPSLVHAAAGPGGPAGDEKGPAGTVVTWAHPDRGINPGALEEFEARHGSLAAVVAAPLPVEFEPLRPVAVLFARRGEAAADWLESVAAGWRRAMKGGRSAAGIDLLRATALEGTGEAVALALEERRRGLERRAVIWASTSRLVRQAAGTTRTRSMKKVLRAITELAGAASGTLWAVDTGDRRRRALALLHPLPGSELLSRWHPLPDDNTVAVHLGAGEEPRLRFARLYRTHAGTWWLEPSECEEKKRVSSRRAEWLETHRAGRTEAWTATAVLHPGGELAGVLELSWWYPPVGKNRLDQALGPALEAVGATLVTVVALEEQEGWLEAQRTLGRALDPIFQKWLAAVRRGETPEDPASPRAPIPLAEAPAAFAREVCLTARSTLNRTVWYFRYEEWHHRDHPRSPEEAPVVRCIAPEPLPETLDISGELVDELRRAADTAADGRFPEPFSIGFPDSRNEPRRALGFPAVVGGCVAGLLAVETPPEDGEPENQVGERERTTWEGLAATVARLAELVRRNVYRQLDEAVAAELAAATDPTRPGGERSRSAAAAVARLAGRLTGARPVEIVVPGPRGGFTPMAARGEQGLVDDALLEEALGRIRERRDHRGWLPEGGHGKLFVAPLRTPGGLHALVAAQADPCWSLDAARVLEALALRAAPAFAYALELDRLFLGLAGSQHATRSAWQQAFAATERIQERLDELRMFEGELAAAVASLREGLERARARMASALYLASGTLARDLVPGASSGDINTVVRRVVGMYRLHAGDRSMELRPDLPETPPAVTGDLGLVELLLENLVENAIKYGAERTTVWIRVRTRHGLVVLTVGNVGRPFHGARSDRLARPYQRGSTEQPGYGIGLSVVEACVRSLGGSWGVRSRPVGRKTPGGDGDSRAPRAIVEVSVRLPVATRGGNP